MYIFFILIDFYKCHLFRDGKLILLQFSVSHDPSEIILC